VDPSTTPWRVLEDPVDQATDPIGKSGAAAANVGSSRMPRSALLTGGLALLLVTGAFALAFGTGSSGTVAVEGGVPFASASSSLDPRGTSASGRTVVVEIVGAAGRPGVFRLPTGSRIGDLVAAAGGYGPRVDATRAARDLNLAAPLHDGDQVRVPSRDDAAASTLRPAGSTVPGGHPAGPIDLNRATAAELDTLPGIGPVTAAKIIASRDEQPFGVVEDLRTRKLVGEKTFAQLKDLVMVS
jgi:competence protein ComEA